MITQRDTVNNQLIPEFQAFNRKESLFAPEDTIIVAFSGGVDSVVLTKILKECGINLVLAHCNFQLRGDESVRDEQFARTFAADESIPLHIKTFDTQGFALKHGISVQEAARDLRYGWFASLRQGMLEQTKSTVWIATAHHANDAVETMLIHLFRGTGIDGLRSIPVHNRFVIRPLLFARRQQILEYALERKLSWVEDSSNASLKYARNFIRHQVLPSVQKVYPSVVDNLLSTIGRIKDASLLYHEQVAWYRKKLLEQYGDSWRIAVRKILPLPHRLTLLYELLQPFGFTEGQASEAEKLLHAAPGAFIIGRTHRLIRHGNWLVVSKLDIQTRGLYIIQKDTNSQDFADGQINISFPEKIDDKKVKSLPPEVAWVDAERLRYPLILRPWKAGDYFYPLGMRKKKKVARFLIDAHLSIAEKEKVWVLESEQRIVWLVGLRLDDRFKIEPSTTSVVSFSLVRN